MPNAQRTEMRAPRSADPVWWVVTGLLCVGSLSLPGLLKLESDPMTAYLLTAVALFFIGALVGSIRRGRSWRWGVAAFLAFALTDILQLPFPDKFNWFAYSQLLAKIGTYLPGYLLRALPVLMGSYVGGGLSKAGLS
jgi:hypothetical protein